MATSPPGTGDLVLLGASTPLGVEVKRRLSSARLGFDRTILAEFDPHDEEGGRLLSDFDGEALLVMPVEEVDFGRARLAVLLGDRDRTAGWLERAGEARTCLDLSGASGDRDDVAWVHGADAADGAIEGRIAAPRPVSATLADLLRPLAGEMRAASATVLLPASELGGPAVEELLRQTRELLSFHELPREQIGRQLAFNILPWEDPGRSGSAGLAADLAREARKLLGEEPPPVDLHLLLAPTFQGYAYSLRVEAGPLGAQEVVARLEGAGVPVRTGPDGAASPVEALQGEEPVVVSRLASLADGAVWIWAVADSLGAGAAENVVRVARRVAAGDPAGP